MIRHSQGEHRSSGQAFTSIAAFATPVIRAFNPPLDGGWLEPLWKRAIHPRWSISQSVLLSVLSDTKVVLVAEQHGIPIAIGAVDYDLSGEAGLVLLIVDPAHRQQGIGTALLQALECQLKTMEINVLRLGAVSTATYLWPGMPAEMETAWPFFERRGWIREEGCADLVQELGEFSTPDWLVRSLDSAGVTLKLSSPALRTSVAAFEADNFPAWADYFKHDRPSSVEDDGILIAQSAEGEVIGTLLLDASTPSRWSADNNLHIGSINALGVMPNRRRQGVGLALAAKAMEVLQNRGCTKCYIQWTGLAAWYGKLGTSVWARYSMAKNPYDICLEGNSTNHLIPTW